MDGRSGATLIEVLLAAAIITIAAVTVSLVFVKSSASLVTTRQRWLAGNFATMRMHEMRSQPYAFIPVTPAAQFTAADCNCATDDFAGIATDSNYVEDSVTYKRQICVNFVDGTTTPGVFIPMCPDGPPITSARDQGLKNIRIRVSWSYKGHTQVTDTESLVNR